MSTALSHPAQASAPSTHSAAEAQSSNARRVRPRWQLMGLMALLQLGLLALACMAGKPAVGVVSTLIAICGVWLLESKRIKQATHP